MRGYVQNSLVLILLLGCASISQEPRTFEEIKHKLRGEVQRDCEKEVFLGIQPDYPLTNYSTYLILMEMGIDGPSPSEWCREYARSKVP